MSVNDSHNNIRFSRVSNFYKIWFQLILNRYLGHYDIYMRDDKQCKEGYHLQKSQLEEIKKNNY